MLSFENAPGESQWQEHFSTIQSAVRQKMRAQLIKNLVACDDAVTAIEYALLGALIAIVILSAVTLVGSKTLGLWGLVSKCVEAAVTSVGSCP